MICGVLAVTLIWIVQNYLQLLLCLVISIRFGMVSQTLTSPNFNLFRIECPCRDKSPPFTSSAWLLCSLHWLPAKFWILFKISLLICKTIRQKRPVYHHSILATEIPFRSLRSSKGINLSVPRSRLTQVQELFTLVPRLSGTTCCCLPFQPFHSLPSERMKTHFFDLASPPPHP